MKKNTPTVSTEELVEVELELHARWTDIKNSDVKAGIKSLFRNACFLSLDKLQNVVTIDGINTEQEYNIFFQVAGFKGRIPARDINNLISEASKLNAVWFSPSQKSLLFCYYSRPPRISKGRLIPSYRIVNNNNNNNNNSISSSNNYGTSLENDHSAATLRLREQYLKKAASLVVENRDSLSRELMDHFRASIDNISEKFMNCFCQDLCRAKIHVDNIGDREFSLHYDNLPENMHCTALWSIFGPSAMEEIKSMSLDFENSGISFVIQPVGGIDGSSSSDFNARKRQRMMKLIFDGLENDDPNDDDGAWRDRSSLSTSFKRVKR